MSKYLFVTGRLALRALQKTLSTLDVDGGYRAEALKISVASLMTAEFIAGHLKDINEEVVVIPGLCKGPIELIEHACNCKVLRGPEDLKDLPTFWGAKATRAPCNPKLKILAEIVNAPRMTITEILNRAAYYKSSGAEIIDIGTDVYGEFKKLSEVVRALKDEGYRVSIDSLKANDISTAVNAGADMVLSINSSNIDIASDLDCSLVVIPDEDRELPPLFNNLEKLLSLKKDIVVDPILPPLMFGFTEGIVRYASVREQFPGIPMLMGAGNVTELTDADSTGVTAVLAGIATELDIDFVLTTEAGCRTRGAVRELDIGRRLMHAAKESGIPPKHLGYSLLTVKDPQMSFYTEEELREMQSHVTDRNYRIFTDGRDIYVFNAQTFVRCSDAASLFGQLTNVDPGHAFYLGKELHKAELALKLGKKYVQDSDLRWGYLNSLADDEKRLRAAK